eukprot:scaffold50131_cov29-Prasinocladus_malaysianus.AAC.1
MEWQGRGRGGEGRESNGLIPNYTITISPSNTIEDHSATPHRFDTFKQNQGVYLICINMRHKVFYIEQNGAISSGSFWYVTNVSMPKSVSCESATGGK